MLCHNIKIKDDSILSVDVFACLRSGLSPRQVHIATCTVLTLDRDVAERARTPLQTHTNSQLHAIVLNVAQSNASDSGEEKTAAALSDREKIGGEVLVFGMNSIEIAHAS